MSELQEVETPELEENIGEIAQEVEAPELSLRETLQKARDTVKEKNEPKEEASNNERQVKTGKSKGRDETGKFVKREEKPEPQLQQEIKTEAAKFHAALGGSVQAIWDKLPPEAQSVLAKRGEEIHQGLTKQDEERLLGKQLKDIAMPYMATIQAAGGDLPGAFRDLLNTAYVLRTANAQQKSQLFFKLAQDYGIDLRGLQQSQQQIDPRFNAVLQELQSVKSTLQQQETLKKQAEDADINRQIEAFKADPKNTHFETVKQHMASLLSSGLAKDLQDAYDQAVYANPHTRSALLEAQQTAEEEKRVAERKARAEAAKKAGSSLKGAPGVSMARNGKIVQPDLRSELQAAFAAYREG